MSHKAVVIDGRLFQSSAWSRGMGRYLLGLMGGMVQQAEAPRIIVLFSSDLQLPQERQDVLRSISGSIEQYTLPIVNNGYPAAEAKNIRTVDNFIEDKGLEGALFIQSSLFTFEYSPFYPTKTLNSCIFYDMIPFKFWETFRSHFAEYEYFRRFRYLYSADKIFSISNAVKDDLISYLGFETDDIVNIAGAYIPVLSTDRKSPNIAKRQHKYVLLPGGDAPHKNMIRAIRGFDTFNAKFNDIYKLLIPSRYSKENQERMKELSPNVELLGEVSDEELDNLYQHAEMVVFSSLDEGLGLPILEAVHYDKKVACSDIPIFKELSKDAFYFFDPYDPVSIGEAMIAAVSDKNNKELHEKYKAVDEQFTWKRSAAELLKAELIKKSSLRKDRHAIVVEQDNSLDLVKQISTVVREVYPEKDIDLFINMLDESSQHKAYPLIFNHVFITRDIADVPKKSGESRTFIFTENSLYSRALLREGDPTVYINTDKDAVDTAFKKSFKEAA